MTAGVLVLVSRGTEDIYLVADPQITLWKVVYRRHTNFSIEPVRNVFDQDNIRLGQKITCSLSKQGDLCNWLYLYVQLPPIPEYISNDCLDPIKKIAWARKLGFVMIKYVDIEIGGQLIDRQYGEWFNIWSELAHTQTRALDNMIGNTPDLYNYSNGKDSATLYIPMYFWFCRHISSSLPLISMHYNDVKIHVQLNDPENCYILGPTNSIQIIDDVVHFEENEVIYQTLDNHLIYGIFINFDPVTRTLYYIKINDNATYFFQGLSTAQIFQTFGVTPDILENLRQDYKMTGTISGYSVIPQDNSVEKTLEISLPEPLDQDIVLLTCELDALYIYLDTEERARFANIPHEYLIEQIQFIPDKAYGSLTIKQKLGFNHPVKEIFWISQYSFMAEINDWFNYSNKPWRDTSGNFAGVSLSKESTLYLNAQQRFQTKNNDYFNKVQPIQHHSNKASTGVNMYSFSNFPQNLQSSGSCNMSRINDISLKTKLNSDTDLTFQVTQRAYCINYNVVRVLGGLSGLLFNV